MEKDLNIVIDNIILTNEIINTCVNERRIDELLPEMVEQLAAMKEKVTFFS